MKCSLLTNLPQVRSRLDQLGTSLEKMTDIAHAMVSEMADSSPNDPPGAASFCAWRMGVRRSRELHCVRGSAWAKDSTDFIASIFNPELRIRIAIANTDDGTGMEDVYPANKSRKGAATGRMVSANAQLEFSDLIKESANIIPISQSEHVGHVICWYLCVFCEGDELRAELSCPSKCQAGYFSEYHERIRIIGPDDDGGNGPRLRKLEPSDEFDISVTRKQA